jgi:hypothetical protein
MAGVIEDEMQDAHEQGGIDRLYSNGITIVHILCPRFILSQSQQILENLNSISSYTLLYAWRSPKYNIIIVYHNIVWDCSYRLYIY